MKKYNVSNNNGEFKVKICNEEMDDFICDVMGVVQFETKDAAVEYAKFMQSVESDMGDLDVISNLGIICYTLDEFEEYDEFIYNLAGYIAVLPKANRVYYVDPELKEANPSDNLGEAPLSDFDLIKNIMNMLKVYHEHNKTNKFDKYKDTPEIVLKIKKIIGKKYFPEFKEEVYGEFGNSYNWKPENEEKLIELANQFEPQFN